MSNARSARNARSELGALSFEHAYDSLKNATDDFADCNKLGSGSFGAVYKGTLHDGTPVAIKRIDLEKAAAIGLQDGGFVDEVKSLSLLRHKNLVTMMGWSIQNNYRLIVYELLSGGDLQSRLACSHANPFPWLDRVSVLIDAASGLNYMHTRSPKHFHRDIKPANILLDKTGQGKLADFGLAMLQNTTEQETTVKVIAGSKGYMDPHHVKSGTITEANEVYSFGVIILVVLTNKSPEEIFAHVGNMIAAEVNRVLTFLDVTAEWPKSIAKNLATLALLCMSQETKERPTFGQIIFIIKQMKKKQGTKKLSASRPTASPSTSQPSQSLNPQVAEKLVAMAPAGLILGASPLSTLKPAPGVLSSGTPPRPRLNSLSSLGPRKTSRPTVLPVVPEKTMDEERRCASDLDETLDVAPPTSLPSRTRSKSNVSGENSNVHNPGASRTRKSQCEQDDRADEMRNLDETVHLEKPIDVLPSSLPSVPAAGNHLARSPAKGSRSCTSSRPRSPIPTDLASPMGLEKKRSNRRDSTGGGASASSEKNVRRASHSRVRDAKPLGDEQGATDASANPLDTNLEPGSRSDECRTTEDAFGPTSSPVGVHVDNSSHEKKSFGHVDNSWHDNVDSDRNSACGKTNPFASDLAEANSAHDKANSFASDLAEAKAACDKTNLFANRMAEANIARDGTNPRDDGISDAEKGADQTSASHTTPGTLRTLYDTVPTPQRKISSGGDITLTQTPSSSSGKTDRTFSEDGPTKLPNSMDSNFHGSDNDQRGELPQPTSPVQDEEVDLGGVRRSQDVITHDVVQTDFHDAFDASKALSGLLLPAKFGTRQATTTACEVCFTIFASQLPATACDNCRL